MLLPKKEKPATENSLATSSPIKEIEIISILLFIFFDCVYLIKLSEYPEMTIHGVVQMSLGIPALEIILIVIAFGAPPVCLLSFCYVFNLTRFSNRLYFFGLWLSLLGAYASVIVSGTVFGVLDGYQFEIAFYQLLSILGILLSIGILPSSKSYASTTGDLESSSTIQHRWEIGPIGFVISNSEVKIRKMGALSFFFLSLFLGFAMFSLIFSLIMILGNGTFQFVIGSWFGSVLMVAFSVLISLFIINNGTFPARVIFNLETGQVFMRGVFSSEWRSRGILEDPSAQLELSKYFGSKGNFAGVKLDFHVNKNKCYTIFVLVPTEETTAEEITGLVENLKARIVAQYRSNQNKSKAM